MNHYKLLDDSLEKAVIKKAKAQKRALALKCSDRSTVAYV
jgi:hypothetical protein